MAEVKRSGDQAACAAAASARADAPRLPEDHPAIKPARIGVLLLNLGTPDAHRLLVDAALSQEFLSDRRVIDVNPLLWQPLLNLVILTIAALAQRPRLCRDLEPRAERIAAAHDHPQPDARSSRPRSPRRCPARI